MHEFQSAAQALALKVGTALPKPRKLRVASPGFAVGPCSSMHFSPCGRWLIVPSANGTWVWSVGDQARIVRLKVPPNPTQFSFAPDGNEVLVRNEKSQFARVSIPDGQEIARFRARYEFRLDGQGCLAPGSEVVIQLAYGGKLVLFDARDGRLLAEHQLEASGCNGGVFVEPDQGGVVIGQTSVANRSNLQLPSALWQWRAPLDRTKPRRIAGSWDGLHLQPWYAGRRLLLQHRVAPRGPDDHAIDVVDAATFERVQRLRVGGSVSPRPGLSADGQTWACTTETGVVLYTRDGQFTIPATHAGTAHFHPSLDLVAVSGSAGFVAHVPTVIDLLPALQQIQDLDTLASRGYARMTTLPGRKLPARVVIYRGSGQFVFESEKLDGRRYYPLPNPVKIAAEDPDDAHVRALEHAHRRSRDATNNPHEDNSADRRGFNVGELAPPIPGLASAVIVSFAADAIDIWPLKRRADGLFAQHWFPVAAIPGNADAAAILRAARVLLGR